MPPKIPRKLHPEIKGFHLSSCDWIPNWTEAKHYEIDESVSDYRDRLAWEFLRRNQKFQDFCQRHPRFSTPKYAGPSPSVEPWGLTNFKRYDTDFSTNESPAPTWIVKEPELVIDRRTGPGLSRSKKVTLSLEPWRVATIFDLRHPLMNAVVLESQIAGLRKTLLDLLALRGEKADGLSQGPNPQKKSLSSALRVADAMRAGADRHAVGEQFGREGRLLNSSKQKTADLLNEDWSKAVFTHIRTAYDLIYERGYLRMLLRPGVSPRASQKLGKISAK